MHFTQASLYSLQAYPDTRDKAICKFINTAASTLVASASSALSSTNPPLSQPRYAVNSKELSSIPQLRSSSTINNLKNKAARLQFIWVHQAETELVLTHSPEALECWGNSAVASWFPAVTQSAVVVNVILVGWDHLHTHLQHEPLCYCEV